MAQIKTNLQYGVTGSLQTANIGNNQITNALMADDAIGLAEMASGTDGNIITYDASGNPAVVAVGTSGHFLKSQGAGSVPVFAADNSFDVSSITGATALALQPAATDEIVLSDAGTLKRLDIKHIQNTPAFHVNNPQNGSMATNTQETIEFDTEVFDSDGCYNTSTFRFTPAIQGKYFIYYNLRWQTSTNTATRLDVQLKFNDSTWDTISTRNNNTDYSTVSGSGVLNMDADDFVEMLGYQNTGNSTSITTEDAYSFFGGFRISGVS
ncbi:c1q globular head like domain containing protein [uncultured Mediterranean phage]|nr:c1q globular head like domain containing protein [uncultured Mediterranean phage]